MKYHRYKKTQFKNYKPAYNNKYNLKDYKKSNKKNYLDKNKTYKSGNYYKLCSYYQRLKFDERVMLGLPRLYLDKKPFYKFLKDCKLKYYTALGVANTSLFISADKKHINSVYASNISSPEYFRFLKILSKKKLLKIKNRKLFKVKNRRLFKLLEKIFLKNNKHKDLKKKFLKNRNKKKILKKSQHKKKINYIRTFSTFVKSNKKRKIKSKKRQKKFLKVYRAFLKLKKQRYFKSVDFRNILKARALKKKLNLVHFAIQKNLYYKNGGKDLKEKFKLDTNVLVNKSKFLLSKTFRNFYYKYYFHNFYFQFTKLRVKPLFIEPNLFNLNNYTYLNFALRLRRSFQKRVLFSKFFTNNFDSRKEYTKRFSREYRLNYFKSRYMNIRIRKYLNLNRLRFLTFYKPANVLKQKMNVNFMKLKKNKKYGFVKNLLQTLLFKKHNSKRNNFFNKRNNFFNKRNNFFNKRNNFFNKRNNFFNKRNNFFNKRNNFFNKKDKFSLTLKQIHLKNFKNFRVKKKFLVLASKYPHWHYKQARKFLYLLKQQRHYTWMDRKEKFFEKLTTFYMKFTPKRKNLFTYLKNISFKKFAYKPKELYSFKILNKTKFKKHQMFSKYLLKLNFLIKRNRRKYWKKNWKFTKLNRKQYLARKFFKRSITYGTYRRQDSFRILHNFRTIFLKYSYGYDKKILLKKFKKLKSKNLKKMVNFVTRFLWYLERSVNILLVKSKYVVSVKVSNHLIRYGFIDIDSYIYQNPYLKIDLFELVRIARRLNYIRLLVVNDCHKLRFKKKQQVPSYIETNKRILSLVIFKIPSLTNFTSISFKKVLVGLDRYFYLNLPLISALF